MLKCLEGKWPLSAIHCGGKELSQTNLYKSDVWLTVHRNSVWIRKTN